MPGAARVRTRRAVALGVGAAMLASLMTLVAAPPAAAAEPPGPSGRIVYLVDDHDTFSTELWIAEADGSNPRKLLDRVAPGANPSWHPAGGLIAVEVLTPHSYHQLMGPARLVVTVDPVTGATAEVTSPPEPETRTFPCVPYEPGCTMDITDHDVWDDRLLDWAPGGDGMLVRRSFYAAFSEVDTPDRSYWRITGAGGALTDAGRKITFPGGDDWSHGEGCMDWQIESPLPEVTGFVQFLPSVETDRYAYALAHTCSWDGSYQQQYVDGVAFDPTFPVPDEHDEGAGGINTIAPDGRLTVYGPGGLWQTTTAGSPSTPLTVPTTSPYPLNVARFPAADCYGTISSISEASWASSGSYLVFDAIGAIGVPHGTPEPYGSKSCTIDDVQPDELGLVKGIWKVDPEVRVPELLIRDGYAPDVECTAGSCLTLLKIITTAANLDIEDDPQFTYSGAVNGTTGAVNPLGTGGVLAARVSAGVRTVNAHGATDYVLESVQCSGPSSRAGGQVSVTVAPDDITTCTFHYVNGDPDPCQQNPGRCEDSDGDGRSDEAEGPPGTDTDGDGTPDSEDTDSDDDGLPDATESGADSDGDGIPDWRDPAPQAEPCDARFTSAQVDAQSAFDTEMWLDVGLRWCTDGETTEVSSLPNAVSSSVFVQSDTVLQQALAQLEITLRPDETPAESVQHLANGSTKVIVTPHVEACLDSGAFLLRFAMGGGKFAGKKAWESLSDKKRAALVESFMGTVVKTSKKAIDGVILRVFDDAASRSTAQALTRELFAAIELLAGEMIEHGIEAVLDLIPDVCVTTWEGRLNLHVFPNGAVTDIWEKTDGASWIIDQRLETAGA